MEISATLLGKLAILTMAWASAACIEQIESFSTRFASREDVVVYNIADYYKGADTSLSFKTSDPGVSYLPFISNKNVNLELLSDCHTMRVGEIDNLDLVFGICDQGKSIVQIKLDPVTWTIEGEGAKYLVLDAGLVAKDLRVYNKTNEVGSPATNLIVVGLKQDGDKSFLTLTDISLETWTAKTILCPSSNSDISITEPSLAYDSSQSSGLVVVWDKKPVKEFLTFAVATYQKGELAFVDYWSDVTDNNSPLIKMAKLKNLFVSGNNFYPIYYQTNIKMATCELINVEKRRTIECTKAVDVFYNLDDQYNIELEISRSHQLTSIVYISSTKLLRSRVDKNFELSEKEEKLYFEYHLDLKAGYDLDFANKELILYGVDTEAQPLLIHWKTKRATVFLERPTSVRMTGMVARMAVSDIHKTEVLYFDATKKAFNVLYSTSPKFVIDLNSPQNKDKKELSIDFVVFDRSSERAGKIEIKVSSDLIDGMRLAFPAEYRQYTGIQTTVPFSDTFFAGNAPRFEVETSAQGLKAEVFFAKRTNLAIQLDENLTPRKIYSAGRDLFLFEYEGFYTIYRCSRTEDHKEVKCDIVKQVKDTETETILDAKADKNLIFVVSKKAPEDPQQLAPLVLRKISISDEGSDKFVYNDKSHTIEAKDAVAVIRINNNYVFLDIVARNSTTNSWRLFMSSFPAKGSLPDVLNVSSAIPPHVCPTQIMWAPRKEQMLLIESLCTKGEREILEFAVDNKKATPVELFKTFSFNTRSKTEFCITGSLIVIVDYEKNSLYGIDRSTSQLSRVTFPFTSAGFTKIMGFACTRHNDYFQIYAIKKDQNQQYLVTYRTNTANDPSKRVHSIVPLTPSTSDRLLAQSVTFLDQNIFTFLISFDRKIAEAVAFRLDIPLITIDSTEVTEPTECTLKVTLKSDLDEGSEPKVITKDVKLFLMKMDAGLVVQPVKDARLVVKTDSSFADISNLFEWEGIQTKIELTGDQGDLNKVSLSRFLNYEPEMFKLNFKFKGLRAAGDVIFGWNDGDVSVFNGTETAELKNIYITNAEAIRGNFTDGDGVSTKEYIYFIGYSGANENSDTRVFVVFQDDDGKWTYCDSIIGDGITHLEVHLLDPLTKTFIYGAADAKLEALKVGVFSVVNDPLLGMHLIRVDRERVIKSVHKKFAHAFMLMIDKKVRVIYNLRSSEIAQSLTINPSTLEVLADVPINFGNFTTWSFDGTQMECTEFYNPHKAGSETYKDTDLHFYCAASDSRLMTISFVIQYFEDVKKPPAVVNMTAEPIIQGFEPVKIRTHQGFTIVILEKIKDYDAKNLPSLIQKDSVLLQVWRNGEAPIHSVFRLSDLGMPEVSEEVIRTASFSMDVTYHQGKPVLLIADDLTKNELRAATLSQLGIAIKDRTVDMSKLSLSVTGLTNTVTVELGGVLSVKPHKNLLLIMYIISGILGAMILLAICYYFCQSRGLQSDLNEPEIIEQPNATTTIGDGSSYTKL
jgi:hypothetical protein